MGIAYGGGKFIGYNITYISSGYIYSEDGQTFKRYDCGSVFQVPYYRGICYGNGKFVGIEYYGLYFTSSSDGITWTKSENIGSNVVGQDFKSICFGNGKFVAVCTNGSAVSTDGINWTTNFPVYNFRVVCYGMGKYIACGYNTGIYYSTDGLNWTKTSEEQNINNICYGNGVYFGLQKGIDASIPSKGVLSYDGINWETTSVPSVIINHLYYCLGVFILFANDSPYAYYSYDCNTWNTFSGITDSKYSFMCYGDGHLVFLGGGHVLTHTIKKIPDIITNFINLLYPINTAISTTNSSLIASPGCKFPGTTWKRVSSSNGIYTYERIE